jgi:hypothetical protein
MFAIKTRLFVLGLALALAAVTATPVLAGSRISATLDTTDDAAVELARGVLGAPAADVYAPTGETVDLTLTVAASRLAN